MSTLLVTQPRPRPAAPAAGGELAGVGRLVRLALRRDRIRITAFSVGFAAAVAASYSAGAELYPTLAERLPAVELWNASPALVAMFGRIYDLGSLGALATIKLLGFYGAVIAVIMVFQMVRHTRGDEDAGRLELVSSTSVGRLAPLAAAFAVTITLAVGIGLGSTVGLLATGADPTGAVAFGLAYTCIGLVFAATTAVVAQVAREARPAIGLGVGLVGVAYVLRAVGDLSDPPGVASWLGPIGWGQQIRPFAGDRFLVALLPLAAAAVLTGIAVAMRRRRDLGAGMLPDRPGPQGTSTRSPIGLAWRLNRGMLAAWAVGVVLIGLVIGSMTDSLDGFFTDPKLRDWFLRLGGQQVLTNAFLAAELTIVTVMVSGVGIALVNHLHREEATGRTELALSGPTSRARWATSTATIALAAVACLILLSGLTIGIGAALSTSDWSYVGSMLGASATKVPASWVITGLAVLVYGIAPRAVPLVWGYLLAAMVVTEFSILWGLPAWLDDLSPFTHSPAMPGGDVQPLPLLLLTGTALLLTGLGLAAWRHRDVGAQ